MTRSARYKCVNDILWILVHDEKIYRAGKDRIHAEELDAFEIFCPEFDSLSDDWTLDFGPNRREAVIKWLVEGRPAWEEANERRS